MAKINETYELMVVFSLNQGEDGIKALKEKFSGMMAEAGSVEAVDEWGKRRFAYEIDDKTEGYYVLVDFTSDGDFPKELDRQYRITDGILRTIIIRKDK